MVFVKWSKWWNVNSESMMLLNEQHGAWLFKYNHGVPRTLKLVDNEWRLKEANQDIYSNTEWKLNTRIMQGASCIIIWWLPRKLFEHKTPDLCSNSFLESKQTPMQRNTHVIIILACKKTPWNHLKIMEIFVSVLHIMMLSHEKCSDTDSNKKENELLILVQQHMKHHNYTRSYSQGREF